MSTDAPTAADYVRQHFRWFGGDADTWTMLRDPQSLSLIVDALAALIHDECIDVVAGIESRGFVLAPAVAVAVSAGFTPVRKSGALFPGPTDAQQTTIDYRGRTSTLSARMDHLTPGTRVALVDDWVETGSQAMAAQQLINRAGAELVTVAVIIDEAGTNARAALPAIRSIITAADLPQAGA